MNMRDAEYYRVAVDIGGGLSIYYAAELPQVDDGGLLSFVSLQGRNPKSIGQATPYVITGLDELPPSVQERAEDA